MPGTAGDVPPADFATSPDREGVATVLDLTHRLPTRAGTDPARSPAGSPGEVVPDADLLRLATWIQPAFTASGLTLADPDTAAAYRITLNVIQTLIEGAQRLGKIDADGHAYLAAVLADSRTVPDML